MSTTITVHSGTQTTAYATQTSPLPDALTNPATSKIIKVTIACAIIVLAITGFVVAFRVSSASLRGFSSDSPHLFPLLAFSLPLLLRCFRDANHLPAFLFALSALQITRLIRAHRESKRRRQIIQAESVGGNLGLGIGGGPFAGFGMGMGMFSAAAADGGDEKHARRAGSHSGVSKGLRSGKNAYKQVEWEGVAA